MRPDPVLQFRLGLATIAILVVVALVAAFAPEVLDRRHPYVAVFKNVANLGEGAAVKDEGFVIGHVTRIEQHLRERRFLVRVRLDPDWQTEDMRDVGLVIDAPNPLQPATLSIARGKDCPEPTYDPSLPGAQLRGCGHHPSMIELTLQTINTTRDTVERVNTVLRALAPTPEEIKAGGASANGSVALIARMNATLTNVQAISETARGLLNDKRQRQIASMIDNLAATSKQASLAATEMNGLVHKNAEPVGSSVTDLRYILGVTATSMASIAANMQAASADLKEITAKLRDDPRAMVSGRALGDPADTKPR
ncbi:MAG TPA: hypothetical protein VGT78_08900 [Rhizomicrobium sp.]|nr:hypothetical protein [Rhizomicrobium sp.]